MWVSSQSESFSDKCEPKKPAAPVTKILEIFFGMRILIIYFKTINQLFYSTFGLYQDFFPIIELTIPDIL